DYFCQVFDDNAVLF
nr:immunoglobulin light chain junction region [Macaca mulatta]